MDILIFFLLIISLFFVSRFNLRYITSSFYPLAVLFFFPGTVLHEMAHAIMAHLLFLNVKEIALLPKVEKNRIIFGYVRFEHKGAIRSFFVGVAPFFAGVAFLFLVPLISMLLPDNAIRNIILGYSIFTVTTMMFFSGSDLEHGYIVIPLLISFFIFLTYALKMYVGTEAIDVIYRLFNQATLSIRGYLFFSLLLHVGLIILLKRIHPRT